MANFSNDYFPATLPSDWPTDWDSEDLDTPCPVEPGSSPAMETEDNLPPLLPGGNTWKQLVMNTVIKQDTGELLNLDVGELSSDRVVRGEPHDVDLVVDALVLGESVRNSEIHAVG